MKLGRGFVGGLLAGLLVACAVPEEVATVAIPTPPLTGFDPTIREQIETARAELAAGLADASVSAEQQAALWGDLGNTFHAYELVTAARTCYQQAIDRAPIDARWPYFLGQLERELGEAALAIRGLGRAVELDPDWVPGWVALGETLLAMGQPAEARPALAAALERLPACAPAQVGLAKIALDEGRLEEAHQRLSAALAAQPEASAIHHHLARLARRLGQPEEADRHMALAGPRQPSIADPWMARVEGRRLGTHNLMTRAQQATRANRIEESIRLYRQILAAEPDHVRARTNLGAALARQGRLEEAQRELERAVALNSAEPVARFDLGTVLLRRGDPGAADQLAAAVALDPRQPAARLNLATAHRLAGRHEEAVTHYRALVALAPASPTGYYWLALSELRLGRPQAGFKTLDDGLARTSGAPLLQEALARLRASCPEVAICDGSALHPAAEISQPDLDAPRSAD